MTQPHPEIATLLAAIRERRISVVCPMCRTSAVLTANGADVVLGSHRFATDINQWEFEPRERRDPLYPIVLGKLWRAQCPMSGSPITRVCDGEHPAPTCSDPRCYHGRGDASSRAFPMDEDLP